MVERGNSPGFLIEAGDVILRADETCGEEFQRDEAVQPEILGLIDHTHAAFAELLEYLVM